MKDIDKTKEQLLNELFGLRDELRSLKLSVIDLKLIKNELKEKNNLYKSLMDLVPSPVVIVYKKDFGFASCNNAFVEKFNTDEEYTKNNTLIDLIGRREGERLKEVLLKIKSPGKTDIRFVDKSGEEMKFNVRISDVIYNHRKAYILFLNEQIVGKEEMLNLSLEKKIQKQNIELKKVVDQLQKEIIERMQAEENLQSSFDKLSRVLEEVVNALASSVEKRDPYTYGHQQMVTQLACLIAAEMGLPENQIEGIRIAGSVHDIGKITVPAEILSKPGRLTEVEFMLIKEHPKAGYDILKGIEFPWKVADFVLQHHERIDGSGYPQHLKGDNILLEARIIGVADVVEAMSNHRPYRPAWGLNKALDEIKKNRGILYDPDVVDVCLNIFGSKKFEFSA